VRVHLVDPPAYTPPYDHALAAALARAGAEVELVTTRFPYGEVPREDGYAVRESFYRWAPRRGRRAARLVQHVPDMLRYRRAAREADVVHLQWLAVQQLDRALLPGRRPRLLTAHDVLPREPRPGQVAAQRRLYERMDAVVVHSEHGAGRLRDEAGVDPEHIHVIPHGAFDHLARRTSRAALPPELATTPHEAPIVLCFGLMRPYKGIDVLLEAWRALDPPAPAQLWLAGLPRMDVEAMRHASPPSVRWIPRFVSDDELAAMFRRADVAVLPYREIDQSGVLFTALAFGVPLLLTRVGGFPEVASTGAAELVEPGDPEALGHEARRDARRPGPPGGDGDRRAPWPPPRTGPSAGTPSPAGTSSSTPRCSPARRRPASRAPRTPACEGWAAARR
jgi:glycosyltransferase involved in cell wall biosynthesis